MTIAEVADRFAVSRHALRYYERAGLLDAVGRTVGGQRRYAEADLVAVDFILKMRQTGMGIAQLRDYVQAVREGRATLTYRREVLLRHRNEVIEHVERLRACLDAIDYKLEIYAKEEADPVPCSALPPEKTT